MFSWRLHLAAADAMRFDLKDAPGALRYYRNARATADSQSLSGMSANQDTPAVRASNLAWLDAEIGYLASGALARPPTVRECEGVLAFGVFGLGFDPDTYPDVTTILWRHEKARDAQARSEIAALMESLPPSQFHLINTFDVWPVLAEPERLLRFARKHDPAGFLTACGMRLAQQLAHPGTKGREWLSATAAPRHSAWSKTEIAMLDEAALRVLGPSQSAMQASAGPAIPGAEAVWRTFLAGMQEDDMASVWRCMTPAMRAKFEPIFARMTADERKAMARTFVGFHISNLQSEVQEATVTRSNGRAGFVTFDNSDGVWRIAEM